ncbi:MAG: hypothetical protein IMY72_05080 [Bacteroidetes bacterium]|nr:hypothetical protein [Bacteroidota bacterium]
MRLFEISVLFIVFISCKKETSYRMQILIKNDTDSKQEVQLFPKTNFLMDKRTNLYMYSDLGNGDYGNTNFDIKQDESNNIFMTTDINQEPYDLALKLFDSIYIIPSNEDKTIMKFYPDTVIGYTKNLYDKNSEWFYENKKYNERTNFKNNPIESYDYNFIISTEKY